MKIQFSNIPCGLPEFYDEVAKEMNVAITSETKYDCTKVNIAENIQNGFYDYYTAVAKEEQPALSETDITTGITMLLVMSGPKVNADLKENEVEVFDGFVVS